MTDTADFAATAFLLADPTRSRILTVLLDGRAHTATELALEGGVTPSTASIHLSKLMEHGLISAVRQGRHRYFTLARPDVAQALEALMRIAPPTPVPARRPGPSDERLRAARVCYDHLAGTAGVLLLDRAFQRGLVAGGEDVVMLTENGERWVERMGIDLEALRARRRPLCRPCLDWSERRMHLGGAVGAAILERLFAVRYARRERTSRSVGLSPEGQRFLERLEFPVQGTVGPPAGARQPRHLGVRARL